MILDELKIIINDMETILLKDQRFKQDAYFKSMIREIYAKKYIKTPPMYVPININNLANLNPVQTNKIEN